MIYSLRVGRKKGEGKGKESLSPSVIRFLCRIILAILLLFHIITITTTIIIIGRACASSLIGISGCAFESCCNLFLPIVVVVVFGGRMSGSTSGISGGSSNPTNSNGGLLYHEVQESKLCAVHCVNTVLQGPFFTEVDLAALASDLDRKERQMLMTTSEEDEVISNQFLSEESYNVSMGGDFSIQVLEKALEVWDLKVIPLDSPVAEPSKHDPELENAFICHLENHWLCIRKVNGEWYNFNSLYPAPEHLTKFYLSAYLDTLKGGGWSIFLVRGNFPKECPVTSSDAVNGFGQWLTPEDAERITKSCNQIEVPTQRTEPSQPSCLTGTSDELSTLSRQERADLEAAIQASLMDTVGVPGGTEDRASGSK